MVRNENLLHLIFFSFFFFSFQEFIREGCLQKIDRKGPQPRMFFLVREKR